MAWPIRRPAIARLAERANIICTISFLSKPNAKSVTATGAVSALFALLFAVGYDIIGGSAAVRFLLAESANDEPAVLILTVFKLKP